MGLLKVIEVMVKRTSGTYEDIRSGRDSCVRKMKLLIDAFEGDPGSKMAFDGIIAEVVSRLECLHTDEVLYKGQMLLLELLKSATNEEEEPDHDKIRIG